MISQQNSIYEDIEGTLSYLQKNVINKYKKGHPFADTSKIRNIFEEAIEKAKDVLHAAQSEHPDLLTEDIHLDKLTILLKDDQIGDEFPKEKVHKIYAEGEQRYKEKIPPGYADKNDKDGLNKYGDLLLWYQLIEHAKSQNKPIIFIIDDEKEDWWRINKEGKILGPKPELIQEMYDKAKTTFNMYLADEFIKRAQEFLDVEVER